MARARNIKPGFFKNEDLAELNPYVRLLFIGLWTLADREGRLEDRPKRIKMELFPGDTYDVNEGLAALADLGFITRYEVAGFAVIEVTSFLKHQSPHGTEKDSDLPGVNGFLTVNERVKGKVVTGQQRLVHVNGSRVEGVNNEALTVKDSLSNEAKTVNPPFDNALIPDSPNPDSLIQKQEHVPADAVTTAQATGEPAGDEPAPAPAKAKPARGTRLLCDWTLPDDWLAWALTDRPEFTEAAMRRVGERFRDHWIAATGKNATKLDWFATWRNWVRNERLSANTHHPPSRFNDLDQIDHEAGLERQSDGTYRIARQRA